MGSPHRPFVRQARTGYQEAKIPKRLPYPTISSSPLACRPYGTIHAPFGLLTLTGFHHVPKESSWDPRTALSYPETQPAFAEWASASSLPQRPDALRHPHQPCSGQPCLLSRAVSVAGVIPAPMGQGFQFHIHIVMFPRWPVSTSPNPIWNNQE